MCIIEKSLRIALEAHKGQKDKAGDEYILHPLRLMGKMSSDEEKCAALLHDTIEDSHWTGELLLEAGIPEIVVKAVEMLSKKNGESYEEFIRRLKQNDLAVKVKLADLEDNINVLRLTDVTRDDLDRISKYHKAWNEMRGGK